MRSNGTAASSLTLCKWEPQSSWNYDVPTAPYESLHIEHILSISRHQSRSCILPALAFHRILDSPFSIPQRIVGAGVPEFVADTLSCARAVIGHWSIRNEFSLTFPTLAKKTSATSRDHGKSWAAAAADGQAANWMQTRWRERERKGEGDESGNKFA